MTDPADFIVARPDGTRLRGWRWEASRSVETRSTVLLVHGLGEHGLRYAPLVEALTTSGHPVVAYDQRGHGESDGKRGVLDDVRTVVDDLAAVRAAPEAALPDRPVLYGHSFGGLVAVRALQRGVGPWRGAVLSAPWLATVFPVPLWKRAFRPLLGFVAPRLTVAAGLRGEHLSRDPERIADRDRDPRIHDRISSGLSNAVERAQAAALAEGLPTNLPALLLAPGDDPVTDVPVAQEWARRAGGGVTVVDLPGYRHEPHNDRGREAVFARVSEWLASLPGD